MAPPGLEPADRAPLPGQFAIGPPSFVITSRPFPLVTVPMLSAPQAMGLPQ